MNVLLTGATGFIGSHVARALLTRGYDVSALVRPGHELGIIHGRLKRVAGDIRDKASVVRAIAGCQAVVHTAALYSFWPRDAQVMRETNVQGTRNVFEAAVAVNIERIIYTSTVSTMHFPDDGQPTNETSLAHPIDLVGHYKRTKFEAERIARRMATGGAPIVIVNPTAPVGSGDKRPTPTGQIILDFLRGALPAYVDTGLNLVDVADVAQGHVLALERGVVGERYILGNCEGNTELRHMLEMLATAAGLGLPKFRLPYHVALAAAHADNLVEGLLLRRKPRIPLEGARMARKPMYVDPSKAVRELEMPQSSVPNALSEAVEWYRAHGYVAAS